MASSKTSASVALFLSLNLLFFALVSATPAPTPMPATCLGNAQKVGACTLALSLKHIFPFVSDTPCCNLIQGLGNVEATTCLCSIIELNKFDKLGKLTKLLGASHGPYNICTEKFPYGFQCN